MTFFKALPFLAFFLLLLPVIALGDDNPLTSVYDADADVICDLVQCGKGKCIANIKYPLGYICKCETGWNRTTDDNLNNNLQFLPCVIPTCKLKYKGCQVAPPTPPATPVPLNTSIFDPCNWIYCGEGTCTKNSTFTHFCTCKSGFTNLFKIPFFPCYSNCSLGSDCSKLGITVAKSLLTDDTASIPGNHDPQV
ncbi:hypothetical protein JCGZ_23483 [Jatropha curcas]|uniref:EGF-like domain-containing protein n=1 Tax=Jatropha curcas TaxID=180498 RepID=A0A067JUJ1_JATCU|nr:uncharacterized protein LOC105647859 isoform X2 [Jatropha curcas]KDP23650.1 hypothetical protein JCGZ_23483 [Jatropha curcas]